MDAPKIKNRLHALGKRDWPLEWGAKEAENIGDYYGWCHRYRMGAPLSHSDVSEFEHAYKISLPEDYRQFLTELGNGGAGPFYGIYPLAELEDEQVPHDVLLNLKQKFRLKDSWNGDATIAPPDDAGFDALGSYYSDDLMKGAMPIATQGCALDFWLVVTGAGKGEIWLDRRTDAQGVSPILNEVGQRMSFGEWYETWLQDAEQKWLNLPGIL